MYYIVIYYRPYLQPSVHGLILFHVNPEPQSEVAVARAAAAAVVGSCFDTVRSIAAVYPRFHPKPWQQKYITVFFKRSYFSNIVVFIHIAAGISYQKTIFSRNERFSR